MSKIPAQQEVREIFNVAHNVFYKKWKDVSTPDWDTMRREKQEIYTRYPYELCGHMLTDLTMIIEEEYVRRQADVDM